MNLLSFADRATAEYSTELRTTTTLKPETNLCGITLRGRTDDVRLAYEAVKGMSVGKQINDVLADGLGDIAEADLEVSEWSSDER